MSWFWLVTMFVAPTIAGLIVARVLWASDDDPTLGSAVGAGIVFVALLVIVGREYVELIERAAECERKGILCRTYPRDIMRYLIYTSIAFVDVFIIFLVGLRLSERRRRRSQA